MAPLDIFRQVYASVLRLPTPERNLRGSRAALLDTEHLSEVAAANAQLLVDTLGLAAA